MRELWPEPKPRPTPEEKSSEQIPGEPSPETGNQGYESPPDGPIRTSFIELARFTGQTAGVEASLEEEEKEPEELEVNIELTELLYGLPDAGEGGERKRAVLAELGEATYLEKTYLLRALRAYFARNGSQ